MTFNGEILDRGFWLYIWEVTMSNSKHIYVGRTGDSSSANAASPFNRVGQHLDFRINARGNSLAKRLKEVGVNPNKSKFRMLALGPLYPEQTSFEAHKPFRDKMATFEYELANHLKNMGFNVLGIHHQGSNVPENTLREIKDQVMEFLNK